MKSTEQFKNTIKAYLDNRAVNDELFAEAYAKADKNMDDCIIYILNTVKESGCNGFEDDEIYSMAVHYYDEDNINVGNPTDCNRIVVNHIVELTAEEKEKARQQAIRRAENEAYAQITQPKGNRKKAEVKTEAYIQPNLFNF